MVFIVERLIILSKLVLVRTRSKGMKSLLCGGGERCLRRSKSRPLSRLLCSFLCGPSLVSPSLVSPSHFLLSFLVNLLCLNNKWLRLSYWQTVVCLQNGQRYVCPLQEDNLHLVHFILKCVNNWGCLWRPPFIMGVSSDYFAICCNLIIGVTNYFLIHF